MDRIAIIGSAGSGKSTLALQIAKLIDLPLYHLDRLFWKPGWVETPKPEFSLIVEEVAKKKQWIIDGNYSRTIDIRLEAADLIIFLDYSKHLCVFRALKRSMLHRNKNRPDITEGCKEKFDMEFYKWIWDFPNRNRDKIVLALSKLKEKKKIFVFKHPKELKKWIEKFPGNI
ncbi:DNA topology modulation protein [Promethearchaeum syntrophicum]|uniref:DNA topology modulation protein n=1 Tax=Promethearchaeum syntrophicum TaxID=2594042 RepID=A0A5B9D7J4_9ARCH|nr:DNA topology modulation protein [Candidatus Prometheoarchaeum syntrophicum]QEE15149.1 topology modulation protein [Candidatus Prometheoarchaeum syntrophicum]